MHLFQGYNGEEYNEGLFSWKLPSIEVGQKKQNIGHIAEGKK